jgi:hypothetical protein
VIVLAVVMAMLAGAVSWSLPAAVEPVAMPRALPTSRRPTALPGCARGPPGGSMIDPTARSDGRSFSSPDYPCPSMSCPPDHPAVRPGILDLHAPHGYNFNGKSVTQSDREFY